MTIDNFTFFDSASATGDSPVFKNINGDSLVLGVVGTFVGNIELYGKQSGTQFKLSVVNLADASMTDTITASGSYTVLCPYGFDEFKASIVSLTSGSVTMTGKLCSR